MPQLMILFITLKNLTESSFQPQFSIFTLNINKGIFWIKTLLKRPCKERRKETFQRKQSRLFSFQDPSTCVLNSFQVALSRCMYGDAVLYTRLGLRSRHCALRRYRFKWQSQLYQISLFSVVIFVCSIYQDVEC